MSTITLSTSALHDLIVPVLPHASTDKVLVELGVIRLEVRDGVIYAVATDRYTLAATRNVLQDPAPDTEIVIGTADAAALLKVFKYNRNDNPVLQLAVGKVEAETVLDPTDRPALTVSAKDGNTLVLPGRESRTLTQWRKLISKHLHREQKPAPPHLVLNSTYLSRWARAISNGSPMSLHAGPKTFDPIIVRAGEHFIGIWMPIRAESEPRLADSPWCKELPLDADPAEAAQAEQSEGAS